MGSGLAIVTRAKCTADESGEQFAADPFLRSGLECLSERSFGEIGLVVFELFEGGVVVLGACGCDRDDAFERNPPRLASASCRDHQFDRVVFGDVSNMSQPAGFVGLADNNAIASLSGGLRRAGHRGQMDCQPDEGRNVPRAGQPVAGARSRTSLAVSGV